VGLTVFLLTADGDLVHNPRHYRKAEKALQTAQQHVSRRKQGSHRRAKAVRWCATQQQHVRRQRCEFHHKAALALLRAYDTLDVEAIPPATRSRRPAPKQDEHGHDEHHGASRTAGLHTSMHDAGWRHFRSSLACTPACAGKRGAAVPPAYTSQEGSGGGKRISKSRSVRTHVCTTCGLSLDREANAARKSFWRGQRLRRLVA
jgi:putative transposase